MRLGVIWENNNNAEYRAIEPMRAMARRGHEVVWPGKEGKARLEQLGGCDLVHVYRRGNQEALALLARLAANGTAITYDNDDDFTAVPKESPLYKETGGLKGRRIFASTVKAGRLACSMTTTSEVLAEKYRRAGVGRVEVIPNCVASGLSRRRQRHRGVVVGWVAAPEHRADLSRVGIARALERLLAEHDRVRVECIGVNVGLRSERYAHERRVPFRELPHRMAGWDIGIAPLADIPWNRTRSEIKLLEYAACGVPWLASPVGPYAGLGEGQGGHLVPDDGWFEALERLVNSRGERRRLRRRARAWARRHTIESVADRWEQIFVDAVRRATHPHPARRTARA